MDNLVADFTQKFLGKTKIGGYHILRYTLTDLRVLLTELEISFFCRKAEAVNDPLLRRYKSFLYNDAEKTLKFGNRKIQRLQVVVRNLGKLTFSKHWTL